MAHLGLGAFHRAHQAWYTQRANDLSDLAWGIEAFSGQRRELVDALNAQGNRYTLIIRNSARDVPLTISSVVRASAGTDGERWRTVLADPAVSVLTLTITESGYSLDAAIDADELALSSDNDAAMSSAPGRIVDGLRARRRAGSGALAIISCDNLPRNGEVTRSSVLGLAARCDPQLAKWIDENVSFVSSMVDRITPATTEDDLAAVLSLTGRHDRVPVITEPFTEWILSGEFPAGRPAWEKGGARFVDDLAPFENRKLWLLNAAHSLLAYVGIFRGHETIDEAMADSWCAAHVEVLWGEARAILDLPDVEIDATLSALRSRFSNVRIRHRLAQVAVDGSHKLPQRVVDVQRRRIESQLPVGSAGALVIAGWLVHLRDYPSMVSDARVGELSESLPGLTASEQIDAVLHLVAPDLVGELAPPVAEALQSLELSRKDQP
ncbi:mannitol dehydrogenase family protein [Salinibacterium sp. PAMC 21357]|uniref:mannitol dehydrogenase family protein n=1 Tax=Salinibacterium sp. PAMC 21357 TaxID=1112215 RepID=UPI000288748E|nr:mannitol dehydrogenase family protein [Salinibacterium sp. PAMC 21357]